MFTLHYKLIFFFFFNRTNRLYIDNQFFPTISYIKCKQFGDCPVKLIIPIMSYGKKDNLVLKLILQESRFGHFHFEIYELD